MKPLIFSLILFALIGCNDEEPLSLTFEELPTDVKNKFISVYNFKETEKIGGQESSMSYSAPFAECHNLNIGYDCKIKSKGGILRNPFFIIESEDLTVKIPWTVLQRVFVIKNDSIYYPISKSATTQLGEARSKLIKIDTLEFESKKMN